MIDPPWVKPAPALRPVAATAPTLASLVIRESDAAFLRDAVIFRLVFDHTVTPELLDELRSIYMRLIP